MRQFLSEPESKYVCGYHYFLFYKSDKIFLMGKENLIGKESFWISAKGNLKWLFDYEEIKDGFEYCLINGLK